MSEARFSYETEKVRHTVAEVREPSAKYLVKSGYTQTEIGMFPRQWEVKTLSELGVFSKGLGIKKNEATSGNLPCIRYGEIYTHHNDVIRIYNSFISSDVAASSKRLKKGDILFAGSGETKEEIGKAVAFLGEDEVYAGGDIVIFTPKRGVPTFLGYLLNSPAIVKQKSSKGQGDAVVHISATALGSVLIALPTVDEQHAIATALSDVDALIAGLEKLIAKKRDIKQAAMQQLLTGQTRLPGFSGEWEHICTGDIGYFRGGNGFPNIQQGDLEGDYPFYKVSDMNNEGNGTFMSDANNWISEATRNNLGATAFPVDSIIFAKVGAAVFLERKKILTRPSCIDNNLAALMLDKSRAVVRFVHYALLHIKFGNFVSTTALPSLNAAVLARIPLLLPPLKEQTAITTVLSDIDTDLSALEFRLAKTRDLKQGMMQELLTGRTRLV